jgi:uncharacterized protein YqcC (DUF446 family)
VQIFRISAGFLGCSSVGYNRGMPKKTAPNSARKRSGSHQTPRTKNVVKRLAAVIEAMKTAGYWQLARPPASAFENMGAFGTNTMAFTVWLRWVFVPNVEQRVASDGPWPSSSSVAVQATREFDGNIDPGVPGLISALSDFDSIFR